MKVICINEKKLRGNSEGPALELNKEYEVKSVHTDTEGYEHYDIGLVSKIGYVRSYDHSKEEQLPNSGHGGIHWCHPSRFSIVEIEVIAQNDATEAFQVAHDSLI